MPYVIRFPKSAKSAFLMLYYVFFLASVAALLWQTRQQNERSNRDSGRVMAEPYRGSKL